MNEDVAFPVRGMIKPLTDMYDFSLSDPTAENPLKRSPDGNWLQKAADAAEAEYSTFAEADVKFVGTDGVCEGFELLGVYDTNTEEANMSQNTD